MANIKTTSFLTNLAITIILSLLFVWLLLSVASDGEVQSFDPYNILEIDTGADNKAIKRAYRTLSLKYHPDKNPGDRAAEAKFMMITKAYEALTDEAARENWEKYGNPDGKQSMQVSIGLPSWLLDTNNRNLVLVAYLVLMVGVIPLVVWTYYSDSSKYGEKDVMYDTYSWYHYCMNENTATKALPEIMAGSAEFRKRNKPLPGEKQEIAKLASSMKSQMLKPKYNHPVIVKGNVLLHAHLLRLKLQDEKQQDDLKYMLRYSTSLIQAMISVCKHQDWMATAMHCIELEQYVTQAMWTGQSPLLQLPHFGMDQVKALSKIKTVQDYRKAADEVLDGNESLSDSQKADIKQYLKLFPDISVETNVFVDDDEDNKVYEGDLVTIQVIVTRNNLNKGEKAGLVHAPYFPFPKKEAFWILLGQLQQGKIISIEKIGNPNCKVEHRFKLMAPPKGHYVFDLVVKSNAYVGCDVSTKIEMECLDASVLPEYKVHPDDAELDDEPTLFEELMAGNVERDSDNDSSDEEEEEEQAPVSAAAKKKAQLRQRRNESDSDDDDSDAEEVYADK
jgi:translocation protein SEC63